MAEILTSQDPSSCCNSGEVVVKHWDWQVEPDFIAKKLSCSVTLQATTIKDSAAKLVLDVCDLKVNLVVNADNGEHLQFELQSPSRAFGSTLCIALPTSCTKKGAEVKVTVYYETSPSCTAVQWLQPAQTAGKIHPYLYTQCQPIHARSMLPCQDTPSVKTTYSAKVTVPSELTALMSGERLGSEPHPTETGKKVFRFQQKVPIPSYLVAIVVGALECRKIGPRSHVWSEKEVVDKAAWEFEETDKMLQAAEEIVGMYIWGQYDLLVMPPSFPYGGMENPCLTFVSPTLLAGDRSLANVVAHEISHSWTGNLVTNRTWEEFWLNEGITTYLERKIVGKLHGEQERHLHAMDGWKALKDAIERFQCDNKYALTALVPRLTGVHPDDAFSCIPYEKGSALLFYLETLLGGPGSLDEFLKTYVEKFKFATISSEEWKEYFLNFFHKQVSEGVFNGVEWEKWLYTPGMPPYTPQYDTTLADASATLADKWATVELTDSGLSQFSAHDITQMTSRAVQEFLNQLLAKPPLPVEVLQAMDKVYSLGKRENAEIKFRWLKLCLKSKWKEVFPLVTDFITKQGRMKFVRPLYKDLFCCDDDGKALAVATFNASRDFYHSVAATLIAKDLELN